MKKGNEAILRSAARRFVDRNESARSVFRQRGAYVRDAIRDMVQFRPCLAEIARQRRIMDERTQQFYVRIASAQSGNLDVLVGNDFSKRFGEAESFDMKSHRLVEIGNQDADVIDFQCAGGQPVNSGGYIPMAW